MAEGFVYVEHCVVRGQSLRRRTFFQGRLVAIEVRLGNEWVDPIALLQASSPL